MRLFEFVADSIFVKLFTNYVYYYFKLLQYYSIHLASSKAPTLLRYLNTLQLYKHILGFSYDWLVQYKKAPSHLMSFFNYIEQHKEMEKTFYPNYQLTRFSTENKTKNYWDW